MATHHPPNLIFLVIDDFGVKYINKADADHLIVSFKNSMKYFKTVQGDYTAVSH